MAIFVTDLCLLLSDLESENVLSLILFCKQLLVQRNADLFYNLVEFIVAKLYQWIDGGGEQDLSVSNILSTALSVHEGHPTRDILPNLMWTQFSHSDWTVEWLPPQTAVQSVLRGRSGMSQIRNGQSENLHIRVTAAPLH